jgi:hypothetical protein
MPCNKWPDIRGKLIRAPPLSVPGWLRRETRIIRTGDNAVSTMDEHAIAHLADLANLSLPEHRLEPVATAFSSLLAAANELNHKMSAEQMRSIKPVISFVRFSRTEG